MTPAASVHHDALIYGTDDEFVAGTVGFVRAGLAERDAVVAAVTRSNAALLRAALGVDAAAVSFLDRDGWYRRPAGTIAGWRRLLGEAAERGHRRVRVIGEVGFGPAGRHPTWIRYEAALNRVFAGAPVWIVCPYDTRVLPPDLLAAARRTHPAVCDPVRRDSGDYLPAEELLGAVPEPMPAVSGPPTLTMRLTGSVAAARRAVRDAVAGGGVTFDRLDELLIATSELVSNGIRHGGGRRELRVWASPARVVGEVTDEGPGLTDPLLGYRPPGTSPLGGRGLWIAQQVCDALAVRRCAGTTVVRFAIDRSAAAAPPAGAPAPSG